jgi:DedD protein
MPRPATATSVPIAPVAIPGIGSVVVQVAAVSHQEDAEALMNALKKHGYNVAIHQEPQDKLMHVQIGPFASKKDAEAMRQRLLADGYNAIVK